MAWAVKHSTPILYVYFTLTLAYAAAAAKEQVKSHSGAVDRQHSLLVTETSSTARRHLSLSGSQRGGDAAKAAITRESTDVISSSSSSDDAGGNASSDGSPLPPSRCPGQCTQYGTCYEELGRCDCPLGRTGPDCSTLVPEPDLTRLCAAHGHTNVTCGRELEPAMCLNACNFRGRCVGGVCHCTPGFFGADCSLSLAAAPPPPGGGGAAAAAAAGGGSRLRLELLAGQNYTTRPSGPRIYVYELPPELNTYHNLDRLDRPLMYLIWQRLLSAGLRVADPAAADFFLVPIRVRMAYDSDRVVQVVSYIRSAWPHWNATGGGGRHVFVHTGDWGRDELSEDAQLLTRNATWLTHWGLARDHEFAGWKASHRPGRDVVLPLMLAASVISAYHLPRASPLHPAGPRPGRPTTLFFAGRICGSRARPATNGTFPNCPDVLGSEDAYSAATRQRAFFHHHGRPNWKVVTTSRTFAQDMATAKFCLAPSGGGQGKRSILAALMGCVPVPVTDGLMQPFEPELRWERFAVGVRERDLPVMHELLERLAPDQLAGFQGELPCAAQHLFWSSLYGSVWGEDGAYDAFETLVQVLRMRANYPNVAPEEYEFVDAAFAAFMACREPPPPAAAAAAGQRSLAASAAAGGGGAASLRPPPQRRRPAATAAAATALRAVAAASPPPPPAAAAAPAAPARQPLCSHSALPTPGAASCSRCVRRRGRLLNPGGTICCNTRDLAKCPRLWD